MVTPFLHSPPLAAGLEAGKLSGSGSRRESDTPPGLSSSSRAHWACVLTTHDCCVTASEMGNKNAKATGGTRRAWVRDGVLGSPFVWALRLLDVSFLAKVMAFVIHAHSFLACHPVRLQFSRGQRVSGSSLLRLWSQGMAHKQALSTQLPSRRRYIITALSLLPRAHRLENRKINTKTTFLDPREKPGWKFQPQ